MLIDEEEITIIFADNCTNQGQIVRITYKVDVVSTKDTTFGVAKDKSVELIVHSF